MPRASLHPARRLDPLSRPGTRKVEIEWSRLVTTVDVHICGEVGIDEEYTALSITKGEFHGKLREKTAIEGVRAVLPEVSGRAFIYGSSQSAVDTEDPYPLGICLFDIRRTDVPKTGTTRENSKE